MARLSEEESWMKKVDDDIEKLKKQNEHLKMIITTLIAWIAGSSVSPLNQSEAKKLIEMVNESK